MDILRNRHFLRPGSMNVEDLARIKNYGEEGRATHRQENQQIKIFTIGHFASIYVEIFVYNN